MGRGARRWGWGTEVCVCVGWPCFTPVQYHLPSGTTLWSRMVEQVGSQAFVFMFQKRETWYSEMFESLDPGPSHGSKSSAPAGTHIAFNRKWVYPSAQGRCTFSDAPVSPPFLPSTAPKWEFYLWYEYTPLSLGCHCIWGTIPGRSRTKISALMRLSLNSAASAELWSWTFGVLSDWLKEVRRIPRIP